MKRQKEGNTKALHATSRPADQGYGILYVVSTPIGNLEDITLRALKILKSVDLIAAENVLYSRGLCRHYGIHTRVTGYHQHNRKVKGPELLKYLKSGSNIALITNAGTPAISDPGVLLVNQALENNIKVSPIPGPSAVIAAVSISGLRTDGFTFVGFLSNKAGKRRKELQSLGSEHRAMVFFEAPHRLQAMMRDMMEILGDRSLVLMREMTKIYEERKAGLISVILEDLDRGEIKGEITLVVAGKGKRADEQAIDNRIQKEIKRLLEENKMGVKEIALKLSSREGLSYRTLYRECLNMKKSL